MRHTPESELFDHDGDADPHAFQEGTVGWPGSPEVTELGTEAGDGMTFVRVTLTRHGAPSGKPTSDDGLANGFKVLARPMGPFWRVPRRGERVLVVFPDGDWETPGNGVILGVIGASPAQKFGRLKSVMDLGDVDLVIKSGKSITLLVENGDGGGTTHRHQISISGEGGVQVLSDGSGLFAKDGELNIKTLDANGGLRQALVMTQDETSLSDHSAAPLSTAALTLKGGNATVAGQFINITAATTLNLGQLASPATPVRVGVGPVGVPSTRIFASP